MLIDSSDSVMIFGQASAAFYKIICVSAGCFLSYLGYRLFKSGIWGHAGDLEIETFKENRIVLKSAAPGTFFVVLGAFVIIHTIHKGLNYEASFNTNHKEEITEHWKSAPPVPDIDSAIDDMFSDPGPSTTR